MVAIQTAPNLHQLLEVILSAKRGEHQRHAWRVLSPCCQKGVKTPDCWLLPHVSWCRWHDWPPPSLSQGRLEWIKKNISWIRDNVLILLKPSGEVNTQMFQKASVYLVCSCNPPSLQTSFSDNLKIQTWVMLKNPTQHVWNYYVHWVTRPQCCTVSSRNVIWNKNPG